MQNYRFSDQGRCYAKLQIQGSGSLLCKTTDSVIRVVVMQNYRFSDQGRCYAKLQIQ